MPWGSSGPNRSDKALHRINVSKRPEALILNCVTDWRCKYYFSVSVSKCTFILPDGFRSWVTDRAQGPGSSFTYKCGRAGWPPTLGWALTPPPLTVTCGYVGALASVESGSSIRSASQTLLHSAPLGPSPPLSSEWCGSIWR